jgi:ABC-type Na+ transport system ATPase subunit NatA
LLFGGTALIPLFCDPAARQFFDGVAYAFLAWFFENILPNEYGSHRRPWFLCTSRYWRETCSKKDNAMNVDEIRQREAQEAQRQAAIADQENAFVEPIRSADLASKARLIISHLYKVFSHGNSTWNFLRRKTHTKATEVIAVKDLSLTMYEGQITCLLGHNGAGKSVRTHAHRGCLVSRTSKGALGSFMLMLFGFLLAQTTISMLTGLYKPTGGNAYINGLSMLDQMHQIRQNLGICPQHNVLFDMLTVKEHLTLLAILKGTPPQFVEAAVKAKIEEVGLQSKTNVYSQSLSGGMKRKLSVGMALIGDSKCVFLDESVGRRRHAHARIYPGACAHILLARSLARSFFQADLRHGSVLASFDVGSAQASEEESCDCAHHVSMQGTCNVWDVRLLIAGRAIAHHPSISLSAVISWTRSVESYTLAAASVARLHVHSYFFCPASRVCLQADLLGDRIAIIAAGQLRAAGR